jgi:hypothetical protein
VSPRHDPRASMEDWDHLTRVSLKRELYQEDLHFRECWADVRASLEGDVDAFLQSVTLLCMKPDAVVGRRSAQALAYVAEHGFQALIALPAPIDRHAMRQIWAYDWNVYTVDRLAFSTYWYTSAPLIVLVLVDQDRGSKVPASVRLGALKGGADPLDRTPGQLRTRLRPPNRVLNFVHVTDEPADLVREIGILWDRSDRRALLSRIGMLLRSVTGGSSSHDRLLAHIIQIENHHHTHDLDFLSVLERCRERSILTPGEVNRLVDLSERGATLSWDELCRLIPPDGPGVNRWDLITVASTLLEYERPGTSGILPGVSPTDWAPYEVISNCTDNH